MKKTYLATIRWDFVKSKVVVMAATGCAAIAKLEANYPDYEILKLKQIDVLK